ncbi:MAG: toll/interleukin-1 receptor domain-containing protein [Caulobacterales bacterium]|nr:toll/interleukin-1 receptor domain-containing protein [Caulobacterales bacterium]
MADVFVSYDRRDRDLAERVVAALTEQGLTVWWDDRITPHETWDKTIEREVDSAKKVLVLWTKNSVESDWVRTEAGAARESTPPKLVQARFSDCKVPLAFRLLQHIDLIGWTPKRRHAGWDRLILWLKDGIDQPAVSAPGAGGPIPPAEPTQPADPPSPSAPAAPEMAAPAVAPAAAMGLGDFSSLAGSPSVPEAPTGVAPAASSGPAGEAPVEPVAAEPGPVPVSMPVAGQANPGTGGRTGTGIDKRLLIGGGIALGAVVVIGLAMMLFSGGGFSSQERTTMGGYLNGYAEQYAPGLDSVGNDELAWLADDAAHEFEVRLDGARSYRVLGACDTNCRDVDLYVMDPSGQEIGRDVLTDDFPVVDIPNAQSGTYTVRIGMPDCRAEECLSAARIYRVN